MATETVELHKLKLAELKQECLSRGLEAKGNKQDLINRLQSYLEKHAEEEASEEDVLREETEEEQKPIETAVKEETLSEKSPELSADKKVVKIVSGIPQMERMQKRAERFNVPVSLESKKAARAARFGISTASTKGLVSESKTTVKIVRLKERAHRFGLSISTVSRKVNIAKLKERDQRFGLIITTVSRKIDDDEKLKKRKERFGIVTSSAGAGTTEDTEAKKRKRAERFGLV